MKAGDYGRLVALAAIWGASFIFMRGAAPALGPIADVGATRALTVTYLIPLFGLAWGRCFSGRRFRPPRSPGAC